MFKPFCNRGSYKRGVKGGCRGKFRGGYIGGRGNNNQHLEGEGEQRQQENPLGVIRGVINY